VARVDTGTDLYKYSPDAIPPIHVVSYHVATDKTPPKMATSSGLFLTTTYNQSQLAERKHVARYWMINTAATAVPLSMHPSPLVITTKLAAAILGGVVVRRRCSAGPVLPLWIQVFHQLRGDIPMSGVLLLLSWVTTYNYYLLDVNYGRINKSSPSGVNI